MSNVAEYFSRFFGTQYNWICNHTMKLLKGKSSRKAPLCDNCITQDEARNRFFVFQRKINSSLSSNEISTAHESKIKNLPYQPIKLKHPSFAPQTNLPFSPSKPLEKPPIALEPYAEKNGASPSAQGIIANIRHRSAKPARRFIPALSGGGSPCTTEATWSGLLIFAPLAREPSARGNRPFSP